MEGQTVPSAIYEAPKFNILYYLNYNVIFYSSNFKSS